MDKVPKAIKKEITITPKKMVFALVGIGFVYIMYKIWKGERDPFYLAPIDYDSYDEDLTGYRGYPYSKNSSSPVTNDHIRGDIPW